MPGRAGNPVVLEAGPSAREKLGYLPVGLGSTPRQSGSAPALNEVQNVLAEYVRGSRRVRVETAIHVSWPFVPQRSRRWPIVQAGGGPRKFFKVSRAMSKTKTEA